MGWAMDVKYSVRPISNNVVTESIFESFSLLEALQKAEEQYIENCTRCIIVRCDIREEIMEEIMEEKTLTNSYEFNSI